VALCGVSVEPISTIEGYLVERNDEIGDLGAVAR
jgi:hypothetical protein